MTWVYLLTSIPFPDRKYIGLTEDLEGRLKQHNSGMEKGFTSKYRPWRIAVAFRFENRPRAKAFEQYLKSGSGHAFAKRHLW